MCIRKRRGDHSHGRYSTNYRFYLYTVIPNINSSGRTLHTRHTPGNNHQTRRLLTGHALCLQANIHNVCRTLERKRDWLRQTVVMAWRFWSRAWRMAGVKIGGTNTCDPLDTSSENGDELVANVSKDGKQCDPCLFTKTKQNTKTKM